jgi:prevent-host-death family protein
MSVTVNIHEAKTHLSRLLAEVEAGGEVVIAKSGRPVAKLVALSPAPARQSGTWAGRLDVSDEALFDPLPEADLAAMETQPTFP